MYIWQHNNKTTTEYVGRSGMYIQQYTNTTIHQHDNTPTQQYNNTTYNITDWWTANDVQWFNTDGFYVGYRTNKFPLPVISLRVPVRVFFAFISGNVIFLPVM